MAWDVIIPDTYAKSHAGHTAREPGAAANKASTIKTALSVFIHLFPVPVNTALGHMVIKLKIAVAIPKVS